MAMHILDNDESIAVRCIHCHSITYGVQKEDIIHNEKARRCYPFETVCSHCGEITKVEEGLIPVTWIPDLTE